MSFSDDRYSPSRASAGRQNGSSNGLSSILRLGIWSVLYFLFYMAQQIAELLAPLLLIAGVGWAALPHVVNAVSSSASHVDAQAHDVMSHVSEAIPHEVMMGSHLLTPSGLIFDGILLMAVAAFGATLSAIAARSM
ncbi:MAG: hypothetical protein ABF968_00795 [Acetobacter sp.]|uniref:Uncharacterized protein n=1 Tax=Acetobacter aceti NBRC 14818 TaxID=887700 RepID=A0AB33ILZ2_ACEAC|nr:MULTISPECIES: hypothetical protein [Acetobacter]TCS33369.1 hypothetical protein EDC15_10750 [Acetobacter aceti NBRC 14818]BCK77536.1 hypothetical protein EMQ_3142 [Acetobacter aceti NBRC 14818]GAN56825.1 hypothetical protein Abac_010_099 [Acetobacter aceti NBRC 14818]GBO80438.1 hypothetical protein AA0242T_1140 [Acetobacter aceti NRIC 0242]